VAFSKLIANAAEALGPDGGTVALELAPATRGEAIVARVVDDGCGMAPEVKRGGETGLGLGLCVAQRIVLRHGGALDVATAPGQGTTVTVSLPLRAPL
jgi:signal transduction histidine kinase